jgi:hypothetical protein
MKWQVWWRKQPTAPAIPPYAPLIQREHPPAEPGIVVDEIDTSAMSKTGIHRAWDRLAGK